VLTDDTVLAWAGLGSHMSTPCHIAWHHQSRLWKPSTLLGFVSSGRGASRQAPNRDRAAVLCVPHQHVAAVGAAAVCYFYRIKICSPVPFALPFRFLERYRNPTKYLMSIYGKEFVFISKSPEIVWEG
jgi:hypothetical protein